MHLLSDIESQAHQALQSGANAIDFDDSDEDDSISIMILYEKVNASVDAEMTNEHASYTTLEKHNLDCCDRFQLKKIKGAK